MTPGPRPLPTPMKVALGVRASRINRDEPPLRRLRPECPSSLRGEGRAEWDRVVPELEAVGVLTLVDRAALAGYCTAWATVVEMTEVLRKKGRTQTTRTGFAAPRPEVAMLNTALRQVLAFAAEFGLTPSSRSRIRLARRTDDGVDRDLDPL